MNAPVPLASHRPALRGEAEAPALPRVAAGGGEPEPAGWPWSSLQASRDHAALWDGLFGRGVRRLTLAAEGPVRAEIDLMARWRLLSPSLAARFCFHPDDRMFVNDAARRIVPMRMLSPIMALEAGNLRGGLRIACGASAAEAAPGLMRALARHGRWDCLAMPVPVAEAAAWRDAARAAGMTVVLRFSGRFFHARREVLPWEVVLAAGSRNFRKNMARAERRMAESGIRAQSWVGTSVEGGLQQLRNTAAKSRKEARPGGQMVHVPYTERQEAYFRAFGRLPGHESVIVALESPDGPVAAAILTRRGEEMQGGAIFHDPAAGELSPGHLLMREIQMLAVRLGIGRIDYNATDPWLAVHADDVAEWLTCLVFAPTIAGGAYARLARARDSGLAEVPERCGTETAA